MMGTCISQIYRFVTGVAFVKTDGYVSISGTIDATKANIPLDGGGYYDLDTNVNSPPGGMCQGYDAMFNSTSILI